MIIANGYYYGLWLLNLFLKALHWFCTFLKDIGFAESDLKIYYSENNSLEKGFNSIQKDWYRW